MLKNLSSYKVLEIGYSHSKYKLAQPGIIIDEVSFYRIDGTHIIDKKKIKSMEIKDDKVTIHLDNQDIVLVVIK